jgi:cytoskeletal protein RodZ
MMFPWLGRRNSRPNGVSVGEFGDKFRKAREKKELSFDDVSNVTKISSRMLQAIEEEHFDQLPGGVFNKGFIRAYAKHLGLNAEDAVTDYLACLRQAQIDAHEVWQPERPAPPPVAAPEKPRLVGPGKPDFKRPVLNKPAIKSQPSTPVEELPELQLPRAEDVRPRRKDFSESREIPWRILGITAAVVVLGIIFWMRRSHSTNTAAASSSPARAAQSAASTPAPILASAQAPKNQPPAAQPASALRPRPSAPNSQPPQQSTAAPTTATAASPTRAPATNASESDSGSNSKNDNNDVTVRSFGKTIPKQPEPSAATLTLVIRATETSWISVLADGQNVNQETLIAPAHTSVRASREIVARIGNAAGVTFLFNGKEIPADGAEAEVKTFVFDSSGMRVVPSSAPPVQNQ